MKVRAEIVKNNKGGKGKNMKRGGALKPGACWEKEGAANGQVVRGGKRLGGGERTRGGEVRCQLEAGGGSGAWGGSGEQ